MAKCDLGKTIIDELKLCYVAEPTLLEELSNLKIGEWKEFGTFELLRVVSRHYQFGFNVFFVTDIKNYIKVATFNYGRYGALPQYCNDVIYRIENEVLYNKELFDITLTLVDKLGLLFRHITSIDLARDFRFNIVNKIRKIAKDEHIKVIVNGKVIDKKKDIKGGKFIYPMNFKRLHDPTISVKQAKAKSDKTQGLTLCAYNKLNEIDNISNKTYIKDFYDYPKHLHRLEIHQNNQEIKDYCDSKNISQDISLIFNQQFLDEMYIAHLSSLLRFTRKRKKIDWNEILH